MSPHTARERKVYILDQTEDVSVEREILEKAGLELVSILPRNEMEIIDKASDAVAIMTEFSRITERIASRLKYCKVVVRKGVGHEQIDVAGCRKHGIEVCNVPDYGTEEVANHAIALLLAIHRKILVHQQNIQKGVWNWRLAGPIHSCHKLHLGVIGLGRIGLNFAQKMKVFVKAISAYDPLVKNDIFDENGIRKCDLEEIYDVSDIISLHLPLTPRTHHLLSSESFERMERRPILINVSRGGLIDTSALIHALDTGRIQGAGLDVLEKEPQVAGELLNRYNVIITPHVAWFSLESELSLRTKMTEEVVRVISGQPALNPVPE
ncbi:MAG: C-terminal binding protein [Verrucomicrobia bacterium]|nr:C-terminal binding protein [Verrucomicrobiota bacterium]